jgi:uncharacterized lipoprotein NlpE involved in copper resistance
MKLVYVYYNMTKKLILPALFLITGLFSCASNKASDIHTPEISMSWPGVYTGVTPAADGPGIRVRLTLNPNRTYVLQYQYIDRGDSVFSHEGKFTWDKTGRIVILDIKDYPRYYMAAEDRFIQLDMQGNEITGDLADNYILEKISDE